jgi:hypothetical protein
MRVTSAPELKVHLLDHHVHYVSETIASDFEIVKVIRIIILMIQFNKLS